MVTVMPIWSYRVPVQEPKPLPPTPTILNATTALNFLGHTVIDRVTRFSGVVTSVDFDLYGCIQVLVQPSATKDGTIPDSRWMDINRVVCTSIEPVMAQPTFVTQSAHTLKGPTEKPARERRT